MDHEDEYLSMSRNRSGIVLSILAGFLGACSPASSEDAVPVPTPTAAEVSPVSTPSVAGACELLSVGDIEAVGLTVAGAPGSDPNVPGDECVFTLPPAPNSVVSGGVSVSLSPSEFSRAFQPGAFSDEALLAGIGVQAWGSPQQGTAFARLDDDRVVSVTVRGLGLADPWPYTVQLLTVAARNAVGA